MARILIWKILIPHCELDIFNMDTIHDLDNTVNGPQGFGLYNVGNKLWFQGLISEIDDGENIITFRETNMSIDFINQNFDLIIYPMANIFGVEYAGALDAISEMFEKINIPTYIISCGVQTKTYDDLSDLINIIKLPSKRFITAIKNTGGNFALRGHFTNEFFRKLGFNDAVVTGCPSLYQLGRNLTIDNNKVSEKNFKPILNGNYISCKKYLERYHDSIFIDQDCYINLFIELEKITCKDKLSINDFKTILYNYGTQELNYVLSKRIHVFSNMPVWRNEIIENKFNFSYGGRIHGSIMSILSGVPALLVPIDSRIREMGEFFDIPIDYSFSNNSNLYEKYLKVDYKKFNETYNEKFDNYQKFLIDNGILKNRINSENAFFTKTYVPETFNTFKSDYKKVGTYVVNSKAKLECFSYLLKFKRKLVG